MDSWKKIYNQQVTFLFGFQFIENLDRLKNLVSLNLSNNMIERMEKLEKLQQLRELNLSRNYIVRIEGLETLTGLQVLNLSSNSIEHIPTWLPKRLQALRTFRIANNKIVSVSIKYVPSINFVSCNEFVNILVIYINVFLMYISFCSESGLFITPRNFRHLFLFVVYRRTFIWLDELTEWKEVWFFKK